MISGLFFGLAFGVAGIGAALRGRMADAFGIELVYSRVRVSARHRPSDGVPAEHRAATAGPGKQPLPILLDRRTRPGTTGLEVRKRDWFTWQDSYAPGRSC